MPFTFLKYLQPTHYFRLTTQNGLTVFPQVNKLPVEIIKNLKRDNQYESDAAKDYDLSWQAIQLGYIGACEVYQNFEILTIGDNYIFIRKNFHKFWVFYVLVLRVLGCHNPITEFSAWFRTRHIARSVDYQNHIQYSNWQQFKSSLVLKEPKISVIIPTLNRYEYLKDILKDLEYQDYKNFEVILVDQSDHFKKDFYLNFKLDIKLIQQKEKALWLARNTAIKASIGEFIALSEDDVRIKPNWLSSHLKCLDFFKAQVSAGVFYPQGNSIPLNRSFFAMSTQFATGNAMLYRSVFNQLGLFDRQFEKQRMGDGEFGLRVYLANIISVSNPVACCIDVKAGTGGLREMGSWDAFRPANFFSPRPIPSVLYYFRRYYGNSAARWALLKTIPTSILPYQFKKSKPMLLLGLILCIVLIPVVIIQVLRSWSLSTQKLEEGPNIDDL